MIRRRLESIKGTKIYNLFVKYQTVNYGYIKNEKIVLMKNWSKQYPDFKKHYKYLSPRNVIKYNVGICFDFINLIYRQLASKSFHLMFITIIKSYSDDCEPFIFNDKYGYYSHSFIIHENSNKSFQLIFSDYSYIYESKNVNDLIKQAVKNIFISNGIKRKDSFVLLTKYDDKRYGCSYKQFIQRRIKNASVKMKIKDYDFKKDKLLLKF